MNRSIKYNIDLNVKVLKDIFSYFNMNEKNTIIKLVTKNKKVLESINEYKDNIIEINDEAIYLKNMNFAKLFFFLSKNTVYNIFYFKVKSKDINKINTDNVEVYIHTRLDKIYEVYFNEKYNYDKVKEFLKKYHKIRVDIIIIILLIIIGLLIRFGR